MRTYHITPLPIAEPEDIITYNTSATSCPRVPSSKLSGIIALSTQWRRYYSIINISGISTRDHIITQPGPLLDKPL